MKLTSEKKEALAIIGIAIVLHAVAEQLIQRNYITVPSGTISGPAYLVSAVGLIVWIIGFMKYARAKGRSDLLAIILSLFWIPGLIILLLLQDIKKSKKA